MSPELFLFYAFAFLAIFSAVAMVSFVRHIVAGALSLAVTMVSLAGIYVLLHAELIAAIQILVYAGAIVVFFLFVIMLLDVQGGSFSPPAEGQNLVKGVGVGGSVAIAAMLVATLSGGVSLVPLFDSLPEGFGGFRLVGIALFTEYAVAVELAGLILLAAMVGAIVMAKRSLD